MGKAGRPPGSRNRRTKEVLEILQSRNCDPVERLAALAQKLETRLGELENKPKELGKYLAVSSELVRCYSGLLPYVAPKLQAMTLEVENNVERPEELTRFFLARVVNPENEGKNDGTPETKH